MGQQVATLHCVSLAMTVVGTTVVEGTDCRTALRFARNDGGGDDCGEDDRGGRNRLPRCASNDKTINTKKKIRA